MKKLAILISGRGSNMAVLINAVKRGQVPAEIVLVLSNRSDAKGLEIAREAGLETAVVSHKGLSREAFDQKVNAELSRVGAEFVCLAGFMRILSEAFAREWEGRMLNIHPSLLPLFKGLHVHEQALAAKVAVSGCTVHLVTPDLDDGPTIGQAVVQVRENDTPDTLAARIQAAEHVLYPIALAKCLGENPEIPIREDMLISLR